MNGTCTYGGSLPHDLGKTYWQVKIDGTWTDICEACHEKWLNKQYADPRQSVAAFARNDRRVNVPEPTPSELPASRPSREDLIEWRAEYAEGEWNKIPFDVGLVVWDLAIQAATAQCKRPGCDNEARYDSNYCGIDDLIHNEGRGELRR